MVLLQHTMNFTDARRYKALHLTQSAINVDSFSLYNKARASAAKPSATSGCARC
jgi:hypothetical protein